MKNKIILTILIVLLTAPAGFCIPLHNTVMKFSFVMIGVLLSSIIIFAGLSIYNKIHNFHKEITSEEEVFKTPKTIDEAIKFYIKKNRLK